MRSASRLESTARVIFWLALAFALFMAWTAHPPRLPAEPSDKIQHMLAFGTLTVLACTGYPGARLPRIGERLSFVGAIVELVQSIPALHRDCDVMDWIADTAIIIGVLAVVWAWRRSRWPDPSVRMVAEDRASQNLPDTSFEV